MRLMGLIFAVVLSLSVSAFFNKAVTAYAAALDSVDQLERLRK